MSDLISRQDVLNKFYEIVFDVSEGIEHGTLDVPHGWFKGMTTAESIIVEIPSSEPEIIRCCKCGYWDRDTLRHQYNDFRDWNEAECKVLAERDPWNEINRYTEADDYCSCAERKEDE